MRGEQFRYGRNRVNVNVVIRYSCYRMTSFLSVYTRAVLFVSAVCTRVVAVYMCIVWSVTGRRVCGAASVLIGRFCCCRRTANLAVCVWMFSPAVQWAMVVLVPVEFIVFLTFSIK